MNKILQHLSKIAKKSDENTVMHSQKSAAHRSSGLMISVCIYIHMYIYICMYNCLCKYNIYKCIYFLTWTVEPRFFNLGKACSPDFGITPRCSVKRCKALCHSWLLPHAPITWVTESKKFEPAFRAWCFFERKWCLMMLLFFGHVFFGNFIHSCEMSNLSEITPA